jgi:hypothetical protein
MIDVQAVITQFLDRKASCAVCGAVAWEAGDQVSVSIVPEPVRKISGSAVVAQSFRCTDCNNLLLIAIGRTAGRDFVP